MIHERKSLSLGETEDILGSVEESEKIKEAKAFIKKFSKVKPNKAKKLREELEKLELLKIKSTDISKIIDVLPSDVIDLNKIVTEVTLDADETNKILETVKANK